MKLGVDIDETIVNTHAIAMEYVKKYGTDIDVELYEELYSAKSIDFFAKYIVDIQRSVKLFPDVKESLEILKENSFELIFITARGSNHEYTFNYNHKGITEEMFNKYNIPHDKIIYKCYPKGQIAHLEKIDYFIDDKEEVLDDISKYGIKCIRKVSNINIPSKHLKFDNWKDILNYLLKEAGNSK